MNTVLVLGEGAWGTAIATLLAHNNTVYLWCHDASLATKINSTHYNTRYLPDIKLSKRIHAITSYTQAQECAWIFEAIPIIHLRSVIKNLKPYVTQNHHWIVLSKGIEQQTGYLPTQIIDDELGYATHSSALLGPSYATDLAHQYLTAVTLAVHECQTGFAIQKLINVDYFKPYLSTDVLGVQWCAALKNVYALLMGMLDGASYGDNVKAFILTRALHEMAQVVKVQGGKTETAYGLCGVGDLVLTGLGKYSKNQEYGRRLAQGQSNAELQKIWPTMPEGFNTLQALKPLLTTLNAPLLAGINAICNQQITLATMLQNIMSQELTFDCHSS